MKPTGFTAAMSQLSYGAPPGSGPGDACGRCFVVTGTHDPYSTNFTGPFNSIVVKVTNLCAADEHNMKWCGQTTANPLNSFGQPVQCVCGSLFLPPPSCSTKILSVALTCARVPMWHSSHRAMVR